MRVTLESLLNLRIKIRTIKFNLCIKYEIVLSIILKGTMKVSVNVSFLVSCENARRDKKEKGTLTGH